MGGVGHPCMKMCKLRRTRGCPARDHYGHRGWLGTANAQSLTVETLRPPWVGRQLSAQSQTVHRTYPCGAEAPCFPCFPCSLAPPPSAALPPPGMPPASLPQASQGPGDKGGGPPVDTGAGKGEGALSRVRLGHSIPSFVVNKAEPCPTCTVLTYPATLYTFRTCVPCIYPGPSIHYI